MNCPQGNQMGIILQACWISDRYSRINWLDVLVATWRSQSQSALSRPHGLHPTIVLSFIYFLVCSDATALPQLMIVMLEDDESTIEAVTSTRRTLASYMVLSIDQSAMVFTCGVLPQTHARYPTYLTTLCRPRRS